MQTNDSLSVSPTATYNSVAMALLINRQFTSFDLDKDVILFGLANPATGGSHNVVVTGSANVTEIQSTALSYTGVASVGNNNTAQGASGNSSVVVTSAVGEVVIDALVSQNNPDTATATGTGQVKEVTNTLDWLLAMSDTPGAASATVSYTITPGAGWWITGAIALQPSAGGGGLTLMGQACL